MNDFSSTFRRLSCSAQTEGVAEADPEGVAEADPEVVAEADPESVVVVDMPQHLLVAKHLRQLGKHQVLVAKQLP